ncbi:hypothetical protein [Kitasatospora sp. NPDC088351]|uniref:hypothetical protein n=2 Tax=unclassified Kitasatospora TaxID=2633591 RepID=UPI00341FFE37
MTERQLHGAVAQEHATDPTWEIVMTLRFVGIDPDTQGGGSPTVWVGDEKKRLKTGLGLVSCAGMGAGSGGVAG